MSLWYIGIISLLHRRSWVPALQFSFLILIFLSLNATNSVKAFRENSIVICDERFFGSWFLAPLKLHSTRLCEPPTKYATSARDHVSTPWCWLPMGSTGVAPEVNLKSILVRKHISKVSNLDLKPTAHVTRSPKQGYQELCPARIYY